MHIELCPCCKDKNNRCLNCNSRGWIVVEDSSVIYPPVFDEEKACKKVQDVVYGEHENAICSNLSPTRRKGNGIVKCDTSNGGRTEGAIPDGIVATSLPLNFKTGRDKNES